MSGTLSVSVLTDARGDATGLRLPSWLLRVVKGPDKRRQLGGAGPRRVIGTSESADFRLTDPTVSALHCEVLADASGLRVRDLDSKNGVRLRGRRVREAWLAETDELELGESVVRVKRLDEHEDRALTLRTGFGRLCGASVPMRELYDQLERAARTDVTVLVQGETGTGKELAAEAIQSTGPRRDRPLVVVDCARLPPTLAESELFGHEKGAFTGASGRFVGAFERAHTGTLFLDEIGELPAAVQAKLLGALERRVIQRVGGAESVAVDVRIISATHRDLEAAVNRGTFRADLYYRLAVLRLRLPALREHPEDIPQLVAHFLDELRPTTPLSPQALEALYGRDYPGNVRELRAAVERAALGVDWEAPGPPLAGAAIDLDVPYRVQKDRLLAGFERAYFSRLLAACEGNVSQASRRSGMNRVHLHEVIRRLGLK